MDDEFYVFATRSIWLELNIGRGIVHQKTKQYFNDYIGLLGNEQAIALLRRITGDIQQKMLRALETNDVRVTLLDLIKILNTVHRFYMRQKEARAKMVEINLSEGGIVDTFTENRNIARNIIDAVNIWIENCMIYQVIDPKYKAPSKYKLNRELLVDMYFYGLASQALSLLSLSTRNRAAGFDGLLIEPDKDIVAEVHKDHAIIYYNPLLTGNQNILEPMPDYANANETPFGSAFKSVYGVEFQSFLGAVIYYQKHVLGPAGHDMIATSNGCFHETITYAFNSKVDPSGITNHFLLTGDILKAQRRAGEDVIWIMGANKYRYELCPFLILDNGWLVVSYQALEQAKHLWLSIYANGGMPYSNEADALTEAIGKKNTELSVNLVDLIREKLRSHYTADFDEIDVAYDRIFGKRPVNYGDYDIVFYSKEAGELFLIEAKFFSDSLTSSGIVTDFKKLFGSGKYYEHCRKRYDLVLSEPEKMKAFVSADAPVNAHLLFVSSKPIEIELQDEDKITTFLSLNIFDKYIEGKLEDSEDGSIVRPTIRI